MCIVTTICSSSSSIGARGVVVVRSIIVIGMMMRIMMPMMMMMVIMAMISFPLCGGTVVVAVAAVIATAGCHVHRCTMPAAGGCRRHKGCILTIVMCRSSSRCTAGCCRLVVGVATVVIMVMVMMVVLFGAMMYGTVAIAAILTRMPMNHACISIGTVGTVIAVIIVGYGSHWTAVPNTIGMMTMSSSSSSSSVVMMHGSTTVIR